MNDSGTVAKVMRRTPWLIPTIALALAATAVFVGYRGYTEVTAKPNHPITFIVEGDLPNGITQNTVDAAATTQQARSYEPLTVLVVERKLSWNESEHGKLPHGADVMLSTGIDVADPDINLPQASRVGIAKLADADDRMAQYRVAADVRETYLNNVNQGQGPSAVVGAAMTAATEAFDPGARSVTFWAAVAALPMGIALLLMIWWARSMMRERARQRAFVRARLQLARVVLELDVLEAQTKLATAELSNASGKAVRAAARKTRDTLQSDWIAIRDESLRLAQTEQQLANTASGANTAPPQKQAGTLREFIEDTARLHRRASALAVSSSVRVGYAAANVALAEIAAPTVLALDEILRQTDRLSKAQVEHLATARNSLLALVSEASTQAANDNDSVSTTVRQQARLTKRWQVAERRIGNALRRISRPLETRVHRRDGQLSVGAAASERERERIKSSSANTYDSLDELRLSLGIPHQFAKPILWEAERVLELLHRTDSSTYRHGSKPARQVGWRESRKGQRTISELGVIAVPIIVAIAAGWIGVANVKASEATYGRALTGDKPVEALSVAGDVASIPPLRKGKYGKDEPSNADSLSIQYVRDWMSLMTKYGDRALLPEKLKVVVVLAPLDEYVTSLRPHPEFKETVQFDYADLLKANGKLKAVAAASDNAVIDPSTGDVRRGYAIQPLWITKNGGYTAGLPLTGEVSSGSQSRLGTYYFKSTQLRLSNLPDAEFARRAGDEVASSLLDLGRELEYNHLQLSSVKPGDHFWPIVLATWTLAQTAALVIVYLVGLFQRGLGTQASRRELRAMRTKLNKLALGLDLANLDAVAVLGQVDQHGGDAAYAEQHMYESMLFIAWREVQELESLPRRERRKAQWNVRVQRMRDLIDLLSERDSEVQRKALVLIRAIPSGA